MIGFFMNFHDLINFLETKMSMSHIYQPLLIKTLIDAGGSATLRQLAHAFLSQDESQLLYYEDRIKQMPLKILGKHGIVTKDGNLSKKCFLECIRYLPMREAKRLSEAELENHVK
jgi:hypothetical protein